MMNSPLSKRLALGTAQFGSNYGIANTRGRVPREEVFKILTYAAGQGITTLDTAPAYGESEVVLGKFFVKHPEGFRLVTKLPRSEGLKGIVEIQEIIRASLKRLQVKNIYGCLLHHFEDFLERPQAWNAFQEFKEKKIVDKIGFSLYHVHELQALLDRKVSFDLIQVPYSIFDRRFEVFFPQLKERGVEIHARSIFLQGLAFLSPDRLPEPVRKAKNTLKALRAVSEKENLTIDALCLNFVLLNPRVDQAVIGVDSLQHLKNNVEDINSFSKVRVLRKQIETLAIEDEEVILPYRWSRA